MDQAARLRELARHAPGRIRAIAVASGKGGLGKTNMSLALALCARREYGRVLLWDADFGLANCDILLDVAPERTIADVLRGRVPLEEAITSGPGGIDVLPAGSGVRDAVAPDAAQRARLREVFERLRSAYEVVVIDGAAGIGESVITLARWADAVLLVTTPEVPAVADAYATLKVLCQAGRNAGIHLLVNMARDGAEADRVAARVRAVAARFLGMQLPIAGWVPLDPHVAEAVRARVPFALAAPGCPA
ncbi:MAG: MinD/ParA family protein, partial [Planctomycetes bacterium]|nr:MinD/ParA family protein [Planctomycetota bacterium]